MSKAVRPPPGFQQARLDLHKLGAGSRLRRIYLDRHADPLGFGKTPSRFSDPRRRLEANRFGIVYLGTTLKVCFVETILRDARNGAVGDYPLGEIELRARRYAEVEVVEPLRLVDLRGDGGIRMGIPSDATRASRQSLARRWSLALYRHPAEPDGILYPSRLNGEANVAVYDRAVGRLKAISVLPLLDAPGLPAVLDDLLVALV